MNLQVFCGEYDKYNKPFSGVDYVYATDGRMALRVNKSKIESIYDEGEYSQKIDELIEKVKKDNPINFNEQFELIPCRNCRATGLNRKCPECEGRGVIECCECGQDIDCPDCDGNDSCDEEKCYDCGGLGKRLKEEHTVLIEGLKVQSKFLCKIYQELKDVQLFADMSDYKMVYFKFDGGEGILLPLKS